MGIHVLFGLPTVVTGAVAMLNVKGRGRHSNFGIAYFWCLFGAFVTMSALAFARWQEDYHLFILGGAIIWRGVARSHNREAPLAAMAPTPSDIHGRVLRPNAYGVLCG